MKMLFRTLLLAILAICVAACGTSAPTETEEIALDVSQEITLRALGSQSTVKQVKIVYSTKFTGDRSPVFYGQLFFDEQLVDFWDVFSTHSPAPVLPGLKTKANVITEQVEITYDPKLWQVVP